VSRITVRHRAERFIRAAKREALGTITVGTLLVAGWACGAGSNEPQFPSPTRLGISRSSLPAPGLCRILGAVQKSRTCEGIALAAPRGSQVLYRMKDPSHVVVICYMHRSRRGYVFGIDVFNANNQRQLDVLLRADDPPIEGDCDKLVAGRTIQGISAGS
jgi:hypothetical protein